MNETSTTTAAFPQNNTLDEVSSPNSFPVFAVVGGTVGGGVLVVIMVAISVRAVLLRRKRASLPPNRIISSDIKPSVDSEPNYGHIIPISSLPRSAIHKNSNSWEIEASEIIEENILGSGNFGIVYLARWRNQSVAVKKLKLASKTNLEEFIQEARVMLY